MKIPFTYKLTLAGLVALILAINAHAGFVSITTPDGMITGNVGGDFTSLVTPYGMITGSTGVNPVIVNLPHESIVIQPGVSTFCIPRQ
jgi:hypothetical protein